MVYYYFNKIRYMVKYLATAEKNVGVVVMKIHARYYQVPQRLCMFTSLRHKPRWKYKPKRDS